MTARDKLLRPKKSIVQLMFNTHDPLEEIHRAGRAQEDAYSTPKLPPIPGESCH
jgi:hypothetical protein